MARTPLFSVVRRELTRARAQDGLQGGSPRALTRRTALLLGGATALSACAQLGIPSPFDTDDAGTAEPAPPYSDIAIVGGGVAGLTCAYRLARAGKRVTLYEASNRFGGRMFTKRDFNAEGMFCELGGELVDTNHAPLMALAKELGVGIQRLKPENGGGEDIYALGGRLHFEHELLHHGHGAFLPIAQRIAHDHARLMDAKGEWTAHGRALDGTSLAAYLKQFRGNAPDWVIDLLDLAYWGEYGMQTDEQSSLNLVDLIGSDPKGDFEMFGESDEVFRIEGGSSSLPNALFAALGANVGPKPGHALSTIAVNGDRFSLSFKTADGHFDAAHTTVIFALPFTKLREVEGIDRLGLGPNKLKCIREMGYGDNAKVMVGTTGRPWNDAGAAHLPVKSGGEFYSNEFQVMWDTSRGQNGARGILTNFLSGVQDQATAMAGIRAGLAKISPAIASSLDDTNTAAFFWARYPFNKGSYICPRVGQYTTILEAAATPEANGRLQFAGEHTSTDFAGFMCGGVDSGERVAKAVLGVQAEAELRHAA